MRIHGFAILMASLGTLGAAACGDSNTSTGSTLVPATMANFKLTVVPNPSTATLNDSDDLERPWLNFVTLRVSEEGGLAGISTSTTSF